MSTKGYIGVLMRWREKDVRNGFPPPAYGDMPKFDLHDKAMRAGVSEDEWAEHVKKMQATYAADYLAMRYPALEYD